MQQYHFFIEFNKRITVVLANEEMKNNQITFIDSDLQFTGTQLLVNISVQCCLRYAKKSRNLMFKANVAFDLSKFKLIYILPTVLDLVCI